VRQYRLLVYTNARDGCDDEFNRWYDDIHLGEVVALPGFTGAERCAIRSKPGEPAPAHRYLAVYEIETDDIDETMAGLMSHGAKGGFRLSDSLDRTSAKTVLYEVITPNRSR
jgi:hypothetical protein